MRRDSFNVLFFIKKTKLLKNGEASVCMRITVNGARVETNIRKSIEPVSWNQAKECARGKSRKSTELNDYIEESRIKLHRIYTQLEENGELITARILQEKFFGVDKKVEQVRTISALCANTTSNAERWWVKICTNHRKTLRKLYSLSCRTYQTKI